VVGVHGIGGLWGALATGIFAVAAFGGVDGLTNGGGFDQFWRQAVGVAAVAPYSFVVTFIILKALDLTVGIRPDEEGEEAGIDVSEHGERGYIFGGSGPVLGIPEGIPIDVPSPAPQRAATPAQS
jgi:Amt family ammonium transporter